MLGLFMTPRIKCTTMKIVGILSAFVLIAGVVGLRMRDKPTWTSAEDRKETERRITGAE